jgi:N-acetylmuramoyl-L-alanine amidase
MAGNIFQDGMNAFQQTNAAIGSIQRKRADFQAAPKIAAGDFGGAAQAYGQAGMADDARQAVVDQQVMGDRAVAAQDKAKAEQAAEAQRKADGLLRVVDALGTAPEGQRMGKLQSLMPVIQQLGIDTSPFAHLDETHLSNQELASFRAVVGKAVQDYTVGNVRYSGATNKPLAGFAEFDPHKTIYAVGDAPPGSSGPPPPPPPPDPNGPDIQTVGRSSYSATPKDRDALARMMVTEAGGEGPLGMVAVGQVAMNRVKSGYGGAKSIADVVNAPGQFEGMKNAANVDPATYQKALVLADHVMQGQAPDPTNGAVRFLNPDLQAQLGRQQPAWANGNGQRIGRHVFYGSGGQAAPAAGQDTLQGGAGSDTQPPPQIPGFHVVSQAKPEWQDMGDGRQRNIITGKVEGQKDQEDAPLTPEAVKLLAGKYLNNGTLPPMGMGKTGTRNRTLILNEATKQAKRLASTPTTSWQAR